MPLAVRNVWEISFRPFQIIRIFITCFEFFYYPNLALNSRILFGGGGNYYFCFRPALSSSFLLLVCTLSTPSRGTQHHPSMAFSPCAVALECAGKRPLFVYVKCGLFDVPYILFCSGILARSWFLVWFVALHCTSA